jgi:hypothetical protein
MNRPLQALTGSGTNRQSKAHGCKRARRPPSWWTPDVFSQDFVMEKDSKKVS